MTKDDQAVYRQGAKIATSRSTEYLAQRLAQQESERTLERRESARASDYYALAMANKRKPWARRWLKANGVWA